MKNTLLLLISLISFSSIIAQSNITITFKDGTVLEGYGRLKANDKILYRTEEGAEKTIYTSETVKSLTIKDRLYEYKTVEVLGIKILKALEVITKGNINLYSITASNTSYGPNTSGGYGFTGGTNTTLFIGKNTDDALANVRNGNVYSKRFKKIAKLYFGNCTALMNKINTKYYKRYAINEVVNYYNENCGD